MIFKHWCMASEFGEREPIPAVRSCKGATIRRAQNARNKNCASHKLEFISWALSGTFRGYHTVLGECWLHASKGKLVSGGLLRNWGEGKGGTTRRVLEVVDENT